MLARYIALSEDFTLKHSASLSNLYCIRTGVVYELQPDQVELLHVLDGSRTVESVIDQYASESRAEVASLLNDLEAISALRFTSHPTPRSLQTKKVPDDRLESVHLEASGVCNMICAHCYQKKYVEARIGLTHAQILRLLDDLGEMQVSNIGVSGGEPLLMPNLPEVLHAIEERDMRIGALFSNGTLVSSKTIEMLHSLKSRFPVLISLDSLPGSDYAFRGFEDRAAQRMLRLIVRNIRRLVAGKIPVVINTMVNRENVHQLGEMYDALLAMGIGAWRLGFPKPTGQFKNTESDFGAPWPDIQKAYLAVLRKHFERQLPLDLQIEYVFRRQFLERGVERLSVADFVCDYEERRAGCCIKPDGAVVSCPYCSELPLGNMLQTPIRDIWYSRQMKRTKAIRIKDVTDCRGCELRSLCGTGCRANAFFLHGDFSHGKDDHACQAVRFFKDQVAPLMQEYGY